MTSYIYKNYKIVFVITKMNYIIYQNKPKILWLFGTSINVDIKNMYF